MSLHPSFVSYVHAE
jgi:hypothetical protein